MRIILISKIGIQDTVNSPNNKDFNGSVYPLELAYIRAYLESKNHEVNHIEFNLTFFDQLKFDEFKKKLSVKIDLFNPDVIGFSITTGNHIDTYNIIEHVYKNYPKLKIIISGEHVTVMYEQIIKKYPHVIAVIGEGEITFSELLEDRPLNSIDGIAFFSEGKVIKTKNRELIKDLDTLPFPVYTMSPKRTMATIITSRGCPFSCSFCFRNQNAKKIQRFRSANNIADEIELVIKKNPNIKNIYFYDDAFLTNNKRVIEICNEIIKRKLTHIKFQCNARFKPFHKELVPYLETANFTLLLFGLESGNKTILNTCHKSIKQQDIIDTITTLKNSNICVATFLIVGLPGETKETIIETAKFIQKLQKIKYIMYYDYNPAILLSYPGTEIYETMKLSGKISDKYWLINNEIPFYTVEHSNEELIELRKLLVKHIAFMPLSLTKIYHQKHMLISILKYTINHYKTKPILLIKTIIKGTQIP